METLHNIIEDVLNKRYQKKIEQYDGSINQYIKFIKKSKDYIHNASYMLHILKNLGYIQMVIKNPPLDIIKKIKSLLVFDLPDSGTSLFMNFDKLNLNLEFYNDLYNEFRKLNIPKLLDSQEKHEKWNEQWWELKERGLYAIQCGIEILAVISGYDIALQSENIEISFQNSWKNFNELAEKYNKHLYDHEDSFFMLSNEITRISSRYPYMPKGKFRDFIYNVKSVRDTYEDEQYYCKFYSSEKANEIFYETQIKLADYSAAAQLHFYKASLAADMLKDFVSKKYFLKQNEYIDSHDIEIFLENKLPVLRIGNNTYCINMHDKPQLDGCGMRKDLFNDQFYLREYEGDLICFIKQNVNGTVHVSFENYIEKNNLLQLIKDKNEIFKNYIILPYKEVYIKELRKIFINNAVENLISCKFVDDIKDTFMKDLQLIEDICKKPECAKQTAEEYCEELELEMDGGAPPPSINIIYVEQLFENIWGQEFKFFDIENEHIKKLRKYFVQQEDWKYYILFLDKKGKLLYEEDDDPDEFLELEIPHNTMIVMLALGDKDEINALKKAFTEKGQKHLEDKETSIFWIIYGPGK